MWTCNIDLNWNCFKISPVYVNVLQCTKTIIIETATPRNVASDQLKSNIWESGVIMLYNNAVWLCRSDVQRRPSHPSGCYTAALVAAHAGFLEQTKNGRLAQRIRENVERQQLSRNALRRLNLLRDGGARQAKATGGYVHQPGQRQYNYWDGPRCTPPSSPVRHPFHTGTIGLSPEGMESFRINAIGHFTSRQVPLGLNVSASCFFYKLHLFRSYVMFHEDWISKCFVIVSTIL